MRLQKIPGMTIREGPLTADDGTFLFLLFLFSGGLPRGAGTMNKSGDGG